MHNKKILFAIPFLAISFLGSAEKDKALTNYVVTYFSSIGGFAEGCDDYVLEGMVRPLKTMFSLKEKMTVKTTTGMMIKTQVTKSHATVKNEFYTLTFTLPFKSSLTSIGLNVKIEFLNDSDDVLQDFKFNIKPISPTTINPHNDIDSPFVIEDIVVDPDNYSNVNKEKIGFDQTLDYFNVDNYYLLKLNDAFITYECGLPLPKCIAHLHFVDYLKIFPYLDSDDEVPSFDIPLRTISDLGGIRFAFPTNMYVNPTTLDMSLEARPGFVSTSNFYLPKNRCEELLDQIFTIDVKDFGYGKTSFSWDMRYTNNRRLIGDCSNSDYCVIVEMPNE